MMRFRYRATDEVGQTVEGDLSAPSIDVARQELAHRGWQVIELTAVESSAPSSARQDLPFEKLSGADAELLAVQMANVTGAGLPLSAGLRALSEEVPSFRVRRWLLAISERLDRGQSLGRCCSRGGRFVAAVLPGDVVCRAANRKAADVAQRVRRAFANDR